MARKKHIKIKEVNTFQNVFTIMSEPKEEDFRNYFKNENPIVLEIGCGHGDYTLNLAKHFPQKNFIGLDVKGARIYAGALFSLENNLQNAAFLVGRAERLTEVFPKNSVNEILIPFPDPHVRRKSENRRLVSEHFINIYKQILTADGKIHFKTDNDMLFDFSLEVIDKLGLNILSKNHNLKEDDKTDIYRSLKTFYENYYRNEGRIIKYVCFGF